LKGLDSLKAAEENCSNKPVFYSLAYHTSGTIGIPSTRLGLSKFPSFEKCIYPLSLPRFFPTDPPTIHLHKYPLHGRSPGSVYLCFLSQQARSLVIAISPCFDLSPRHVLDPPADCTLHCCNGVIAKTRQSNTTQFKPRPELPAESGTFQISHFRFPLLIPIPPDSAGSFSFLPSSPVEFIRDYCLSFTSSSSSSSSSSYSSGNANIR
jgi:hypothetical protein